MRLAIVDDEEIWRKTVLTKVRAFYKEDAEVDVFVSGMEFLEKKEIYDIVILDIEMPEMDGFRIAEIYTAYAPDVVVIILTAHTELSRQGYLVNAFRYLDKMNLQAELQEALESVQNLRGRNQSISINIINMGEKSLVQKDILYIETEKRNVRIHTRKNTYISSLSISKIEELLDDTLFFRCHKSFIVNMEAIQTFDHIHIYLVDDSKIYVSSRKYHELKKKYLEKRFCCGNS